MTQFLTSLSSLQWEPSGGLTPQLEPASNLSLILYDNSPAATKHTHNALPHLHCIWLHFEPCTLQYIHKNTTLCLSQLRLSLPLHLREKERVGSKRPEDKGIVERAAGSQISCRLWPWRQKVGARQGKDEGQYEMWEHSGACSKSLVAVTARGRERGLKKREQERGDGMEMCDEREDGQLWESLSAANLSYTGQMLFYY